MHPVFALLDNPVLMVVLAAIAVMLFGERLPEVARSVGKGLMEVKNGVRGLQRELEDAVNSATSTTAPPYEGGSATYETPDDHDEATAPKFEPPPSP